MSDLRDHRLGRPDGRVVAWSECGVRGGRPLVRLPGTPGSRFSLRADHTPWIARGLRVITIERPGFGASTRLPGRGFAEPADDLAAVLDHLGIDRVPLYGGSGAAPHILAFAARHPERVAAATIVAGAAPMTDDEVDGQVAFNATSDGLGRARDVLALRSLLSRARAAILADPQHGFRGLLDDAPVMDQAMMTDHPRQAALTRGVVEALVPGVDGWVDETLALNGEWSDIDLGAITCSLTWWHGEADRNCPISAARRLVARLPRARLVALEDGGHLAAETREGRFLDELLARAETARRPDLVPQSAVACAVEPVG